MTLFRPLPLPSSSLFTMNACGTADKILAPTKYRSCTWMSRPTTAMHILPSSSITPPNPFGKSCQRQPPTAAPPPPSPHPTRFLDRRKSAQGKEAEAECQAKAKKRDIIRRAGPSRPWQSPFPGRDLGTRVARYIFFASAVAPSTQTPSPFTAAAPLLVPFALLPPNFLGSSPLFYYYFHSWLGAGSAVGTLLLAPCCWVLLFQSLRFARHLVPFGNCRCSSCCSSSP